MEFMVIERIGIVTASSDGNCHNERYVSHLRIADPRMLPMRRRLFLVGVILFAGILTVPLGAQSTANTKNGPQAAELPSVTLPPDLGRVLRDYERGWRSGDAAALAALFSENGFVLQGGRPPVRGRAAIQAAYAGNAGGALRLRALAYSTADTVGYIIGAYGYGDEPGDIGKFTLTLQRAPGGRWMIFSDMDNSSRRTR